MMATASKSTRQFLVNRLRAFLSAEGTSPLRTPCEENVDWNSLVQLAAFHRVAPLLDRALRNTCAQAVPASVLAGLAAYVRSISHRGLLLTGELVRLLKRLDARGIPAIPFKGPALAALLYGDPALRHFDDLDVLVRQEDMPAAQQVLFALGYQPREQHPFHESFTLFKGTIEVVLELHWYIMPEDFPFHLDPDGLWERREVFSFGGLPAATLAPADLLLYLCAHGSRHFWLRLQWICDVAQLIRRNPALDWERVMEQARIAGGQRMLFLGLALAHKLLAAPLPPEIAREVHGDAHTAKLVQRVWWQIFEGPLEIVKPWKEAAFRRELMDDGA
jgi:hypothetical protein